MYKRQAHSWISDGNENFGSATGSIQAGTTTGIPINATEVLVWVEADSDAADKLLFRVKHSNHTEWKTILNSDKDAGFPNSNSVWIPLGSDGILQYEYIDTSGGADSSTATMIAVYGYK